MVSLAEKGTIPMPDGFVLPKLEVEMLKDDINEVLHLNGVIDKVKCCLSKQRGVVNIYGGEKAWRQSFHYALSVMNIMSCLLLLPLRR